MNGSARLFAFDRELRPEGGLLVGVDEVGRGCLAGPVVACALVCPPQPPKALRGVTDCKLLAPEQRLAFGRALRRERLLFCLGWASVEEIDRLNILHASLLAMRRALERLGARLSLDQALVLVDGNRAVPGFKGAQRAVVSGDRKSFAVACASVAAKTARDRWMRRWDARHPGYGLAENKGYGTPSHLAALERLGPTPLHRRSFAPVRDVLPA